MSELPEIYNDSMKLFYETFDVPKLVFDIVSRIKNPAVCGRLYEAEVVSIKQEGFRIKIEFKTNEDTYFTQNFALDNRLDTAIEFLGDLGCSLQTLDSIKGNKYKVFYENVFSTIVLGRIDD